MSPRPRKRDADLPLRMRRKRSLIYHVFKGKWERIGTCADMPAAFDVYRRIEASIATYDQTTVAGLAETYRALIQDPRNPLEIKPSTQRGYLAQLKTGARLLRVFGNMLLLDIRRSHGRIYLDEHPYPVAANREIAILSRMLSYAAEREWGGLQRNPLIGLKRIQGKGRSRYVQDWEFATVRALAVHSVQIAMDIALLTGLRMGDILALQATDYDTDELRVVESKTGNRVRFSMTDALYAALDQHKQLQGRAQIPCSLIRTQAGKRYTTDGFKSLWQRLQKKALKKQIFRGEIHIP